MIQNMVQQQNNTKISRIQVLGRLISAQACLPRMCLGDYFETTRDSDSETYHGRLERVYVFLCTYRCVFKTKEKEAIPNVCRFAHFYAICIYLLFPIFYSTYAQDADTAYVKVFCETVSEPRRNVDFWLCS